MSDVLFIEFEAKGEKILFNVSEIKCVFKTKNGRVIVLDKADIDYSVDGTYEEVLAVLNKFIGVSTMCVTR